MTWDWQKGISMIDDEFYLDDDDLNADVELDIADKEILVVADAMEELLNKIRENIKFVERKEFEKNVTIMSTYIDGIVRLSRLNTASASEKMEVIASIDAAIRDLDYADLNIENLDPSDRSGFDLLDNPGSDFDF